MKKTLVTNYITDNDMLTYDDGTKAWTAKYYFSPERKEFRIYDISVKSLSKSEISILINEFLTYYYYIAYDYIPIDMAIETFYLFINGYNISKKGYDMLTYYIAELTSPEDESINLGSVRQAFEYVLVNMHKLGKEILVIHFKGSRFAFLNFYTDLFHVLEHYVDFPEGICIQYALKKRFRNHTCYLLPDTNESK